MSLNLPSDFLFGISESDLQTVGSTAPYERENAQRPQWVPFSEKQHIQPPLDGAFKYDKWEEDIALLKGLGIKAYRMSISISRTIDRDGNVNTAAIQWYRNYMEAVKAAGMELHVSLYHWEMPDIFGEDGILHPDFTAYYDRHTKIILDHFSDLIDYYVPMNEPWCVVFLSYYVGIHAPGKKDMHLLFKAFFKTLELQTNAIRTIKAHDQNHKIGIINIHFPAFTPPEHVGDAIYESVRHVADQILNYSYSDPFYFGTLDEQFIEKFNQYFPAGYEAIVQNAKLNDWIDYYGVNYYTSQYIVPSDNNPLGYDQWVPENAEKNGLGWPIAIEPQYPNGLTEVLISYYKRYKTAGLSKILITENGVPGISPETNDTGQPIDTFRSEFIENHLQQVSAAITQGVPVKGYLLWSLLDNFEWQESYKPESAFGLVHVDMKTGKRTPKESYYWYKDIIKNQ
jgi:beta-glucosidase